MREVGILTGERALRRTGGQSASISGRNPAGHDGRADLEARIGDRSRDIPDQLPTTVHMKDHISGQEAFLPFVQARLPKLDHY
jgi:hypothetical protein